MATYLNTNGTSETFDLTERYIYGSSRVGVYKEPVSMLAPPSTPPFNYVRPGFRQYELSNHLGNVTTTITAQKVPLYSGTTITGFAPQIVKSFDYSPFGVTRVDFDVTTRLGGGFDVDDGVRYGFQGVEKDDETAGSGNSLNFLFRNYDPRLGRFKSVDPLAPQYPFYSPYHFAGNSPIAFIDLEGLEPSYFATKNNDGETKLTLPVIGLLAELYGHPYWMVGAKANIKINQKLHDNLTGYKSGAITLGFDINYTQNYENASGASWLLLTSHEIVHVDQFIGMFGKNFENNEQYQEAVGGWMMSYGLDAAATWLDNPGGSQHELHDGIAVEKVANQKEKLFENFFHAQNYKREDGTYGNAVIDLFKQADNAKQNDDKDGYKAAYDSLINLAKEYNTTLESEED